MLYKVIACLLGGLESVSNDLKEIPPGDFTINAKYAFAVNLH